MLLGLAGFLLWRRPAKPDLGEAGDPENVLVLDISAEPHLDVGESTIRSAESQAIRSEVRVLPGIDAGTQTVASPGDIVIGERRAKDGGDTPPEGSS